jgi:KaiC/GvpD/RAD55 family RecA-like ATPase
MSDTLEEQHLSYVPSGVKGLDSMLQDRGLPKGQTVLVTGSPGAGKTIMTIQYLHHGAVEHGEPGIYVLLDETREILLRNMARLGFDLEDLERKGLFEVVDVSPVRYMAGQGSERVLSFNVGRRNFDMTSFRRFLEERVVEIGAQRIVVDPLSVFMLRYPNHGDRAYAMIDLIQALTVSSSTNLLVHELKGTGIEREYQLEEYVAQGVIVMRHSVVRSEVVKTIQIEKMRGVAHDTQPRPYRISRGGIEIYPKERVL